MWKDLSMSEKSEVMRLSIRNGILDLNAIKEIYDKNSFRGKSV